MENEKKIVVAYTVKRYEDGSVGVEDAKLVPVYTFEDTSKLTLSE